MNEAPSTPRHDAYASWRFPSFRLFLAGTVLASVGHEMQSVAVGWELYERTGSALDLGLVGLVQAVPVFLFALPAGQVADRFPRRVIAMMTMAVVATASLGLAMVSYTGAPVGWVYACLALTGTARSFALPARWALLPHLVPVDAYTNAVTWRSSGWQLAAVTGPALGGLALGIWHRAAPVYLIDATCAIGSILLLVPVHEGPIERDEESFTLDALLAGAKFVLQTELILATITLDMLAVLLGGAVILLPIFARDILHVGPAGLGWLRAAPSLGALSMALWLAHRPPMRRAGRSLLLATAGFGAATIVFGLSRDYWLSVAMLAVTGALDNVSVVVRGTLVQVLTPDGLRGRVSSVNSVFIGTSNELGGFESGLAARLFGPVLAVVGGGVGTILVVLAAAWKWPSIRRLGRLHEARSV
jgi:MFS family permease